MPSVDSKSVMHVATALRLVVSKQYRAELEELSELTLRMAEDYVESGARQPPERVLSVDAASLLEETPEGWRLRGSAERLAVRISKARLDELASQFVTRNIEKVAPIIAAKRIYKGSRPAAGRFREGVGFAGGARFDFHDGTSFEMRSMAVMRHRRGGMVAQYPTTFHNAVWPDGRVSSRIGERGLMKWAETNGGPRRTGFVNEAREILKVAKAMAPRGRAQEMLYGLLTDHYGRGRAVMLSDVAQNMPRVPFKSIQSAAKALAAKNLIRYDGLSEVELL